MTYFQLSEAERREWRQSPTTKAFFEAVRDQIALTKDESISALCEDTNEGGFTARRMAGKVDGMETVIKLMETD